MIQVVPNVNKMRNRAHKIGLFFLIAHIFLFIVALISIGISNDPQAPLIWVIFAIVDFPVSLLYMLWAYFSDFIDANLCCGLSIILYFPYLIHGVLGSIWWYFLPRFFMSKRFGGIWGKSTSE